MFRFFFRNKPDPAVRQLYEAVVAQARSPVFYTNYGVADTLDGRFEMVVLHITPFINALKDGEAMGVDGQALFDHFLSDMDQNLRTIGVSDLSVPKKMKKMGAAFYGRYEAYLSARGDRADLAAAMARNVLDEPGRPDSPAAFALADYFEALCAAAPDRLEARPNLPDPHAFAPRMAGAGAAAVAEVAS
ncbi:ubiquinol-cytochrome C chaperone [Acuticoccus sediminis]|uniref:Ubiquinol-cytochrome C chaperone n=1 Tax=Acuticoccus sediminis TaxID=2184697 RepID=A0A8B2NIN2_9HYPH|nr:ubiquinol-cytochrome C chaperone family protein [Acuticoccus sediminis]RAH96972.1 ubiquinol-cytochrome C chaperone [Acuticoccus sediminis]